MIHWLLVDGEVWENFVEFVLLPAWQWEGGTLVSCARLYGDVVVKMRRRQSSE